MKKQKDFAPGRGYTKKDWDTVSDNKELTAEDVAKAKPFSEALPDIADAIRRGRGPQKAPKKVQVSLRLDPAALEAFKATGDGWQIRIGEAVKQAASRLKRVTSAPAKRRRVGT
jgi:uncharacterized protein (DUF4415 family)